MKTPKHYFHDVGLAAHLLAITFALDIVTVAGVHGDLNIDAHSTAG